MDVGTTGHLLGRAIIVSVSRFDEGELLFSLIFITQYAVPGSERRDRL